MKNLLIRNGVKVNQYYRLINSSLNYFILDENEVIWIDDVPSEECEEEVIRTIRYNDNHTVKVVKVDQPTYYTESGANKVVAIYESMKCTCVKAMKASEWEKEMGINY